MQKWTKHFCRELSLFQSGEWCFLKGLLSMRHATKIRCFDDVLKGNGEPVFGSVDDLRRQILTSDLFQLDLLI